MHSASPSESDPSRPRRSRSPETSGPTSNRLWSASPPRQRPGSTRRRRNPSRLPSNRRKWISAVGFALLRFLRPALVDFAMTYPLLSADHDDEQCTRVARVRMATATRATRYRPLNRWSCCVVMHSLSRPTPFSSELGSRLSYRIDAIPAFLTGRRLNPVNRTWTAAVSVASWRRGHNQAASPSTAAHGKTCRRSHCRKYTACARSPW